MVGRGRGVVGGGETGGEGKEMMVGRTGRQMVWAGADDDDGGCLVHPIHDPRPNL